MFWYSYTSHSVLPLVYFGVGYFYALEDFYDNPSISLLSLGPIPALGPSLPLMFTSLEFLLGLDLADCFLLNLKPLLLLSLLYAVYGESTPLPPYSWAWWESRFSETRDWFFPIPLWIILISGFPVSFVLPERIGCGCSRSSSAKLGGCLGPSAAYRCLRTGYLSLRVFSLDLLRERLLCATGSLLLSNPESRESTFPALLGLCQRGAALALSSTRSSSLYSTLVLLAAFAELILVRSLIIF